MRSYLLVRPTSDKDLAAAWSCGADALALDLGGWESASERARERDAARRFLDEARATGGGPALYVRVAPLDSGAIDADLEALAPPGLEGVFLSQACGGDSVQHLCAKLAVREAELGLEDGATRIVAMATQTPAAIFRLGSYAGASSRLAALAFDVRDLGLALGMRAPHGAQGELAAPFVTARALTLFGAATAKAAAIDAPHPDPADMSGLRQQCLAARREGFSAKLATHASQIPAINEAFSRDAATL